MKKIKLFSIIFLITLTLLPLILWNAKAITIENTSFGIEIGDVIIYKCVDDTDIDTIGDKYYITIEDVYNGNSSDYDVYETTWMGVIVNVSLKIWYQSTGKWMINGDSFATIAYNATTKNIKAYTNSLNILPIPLNLSFMANHFENLEINSSDTIENFTASVSGNTLNVTDYVWDMGILDSSSSCLSNYNVQGIATRLETINHENGDRNVIELTTEDGPLIPSGFTFIGIACVSIAAVVIIIRKRIIIKKNL